MKENAIKRINTLGKIGAIVAKIAKILMIVGTTMMIIAGIVLLVIPNSFMKMTVSGKMGIEIEVEDYFGKEIDEDEINKVIGENGSVDIDDGKEYIISDVKAEDGVIKVSAETEEITYSLRKFAGTIFAGALVMAAWVVVLVFIEKLCKSFQKCETPFSDDVILNLKNFSISMIPWAIASTLGTELAALMSGGDIVLGGVDLSYVFIALVVIGLTFVFKYGAMLQKETDEIL